MVRTTCAWNFSSLKVFDKVSLVAMLADYFIFKKGKIMKKNEQGKIYSYHKDSNNISIHVLYYVLVIVIRSFYQVKSTSKLSFILFVLCFITLLLSSSHNSPRILPTRKSGKMLYILRLVFKCLSYFIILNIDSVFYLLVYLSMVTIFEMSIRKNFVHNKNKLYYYFDDNDIEHFIKTKNSHKC